MREQHEHVMHQAKEVDSKLNQTHKDLDNSENRLQKSAQVIRKLSVLKKDSLRQSLTEADATRFFEPLTLTDSGIIGDPPFAITTFRATN